MGYKDDLWQEAPGYCVECGNLRPLDKSAVCEECHNSPPWAWGDPWEEDAYNSHWYYERLKGTLGAYAAGIKEFIVFGDYTADAGPRADFKIFDFVVAETPQQAFELWKASLIGDTPGIEKILEENVYVVQVEGTRWVFDLASGRLCQKYRRPDTPDVAR